MLYKCFPFCFDTYKSKAKYKLDKKDGQEAIDNYFQNEDVSELFTKIKDKNTIILKTRGVIKDHRINQDYDEKYFYTPIEIPTNIGDIFFWDRTGSYWIVYAKYLTAKSYNKVIIKRAFWCLTWKDEYNNIHNQWVYVRGPVETKTDSIILNRKIYDKNNGTLTILLPYNDETKHFTKYSTVMLDGKKWMVAADPDNITQPDLLELSMIKVGADYNDDKINNIVDGLTIEGFGFKPLFNTIISLNETFDINSMMIFYKDGQVIDNDFSVKLKSGKAIIKGSKVIFNALGECQIEIIYNQNTSISQIYTFTVEENTENVSLNKIIGSTTVKTLFSYEYYTNIINENDVYKWEVMTENDKVVKSYNEAGNKIIIKFGSKVGSIQLKLYVNELLADTIWISSVGAFE